MKEKYDHIELYCPKLGHHLTFNYCRSENQGLPCSRIVKCCSDKIPVQNYLETHFTDEEVNKVYNPSVNKMNSILSIIQQVNERGI